MSGSVTKEQRALLEGIADNPRTLNDVRQAIRALLAAEVRADADGVQRAGQFLLDRLVDHEVRMTSEPDAREWYGHVTPAMARFRVSLADIVEVGPVKTSRFDPPGLWESEPRSSADDAGKVNS